MNKEDYMCKHCSDCHREHACPDAYWYHFDKKEKESVYCDCISTRNTQAVLEVVDAEANRLEIENNILKKKLAEIQKKIIIDKEE